MIRMGNDEFILYLRKNGLAKGVPSPIIGKKIWEWLSPKGAKIVEPDKECHWGKTGDAIDEINLPKTATQFEFDEMILPDLYKFLNTF